MFNPFRTVSEYSMSWEWIFAWRGKELIPLFLGGELDFRGKYKWPNSKTKENQELITKTKYSHQSGLYKGAYTSRRAARAACNSGCPSEYRLMQQQNRLVCGPALVQRWCGSWRSGLGWTQQWQPAAQVSVSAFVQVSTSLRRPQQEVDRPKGAMTGARWDLLII